MSTEGTKFNVVKNIYDKPRAESMYDSEKIKHFSYKLKTRMSTLTTLNQHSTERCSQAYRQEKKKKTAK